MPNTKQKVEIQTRISNRYDSLTNWNNVGYGELVPVKGEICIAKDGNKFLYKIGDGQTDFTKLKWNSQADWNETDTTAPNFISNKPHVVLNGEPTELTIKVSSAVPGTGTPDSVITFVI